MKVLIVCSGNVPAGQKFDMKLHHAFIFEQVEELQKLGVTFDYFYVTGKGVSGYLKSIVQYRKVLKNRELDLVHAHYGLSAFVAAFQHKVPLISTFHGCDVNRNDLNLISSFAAFFSKANIFVSEELKKKIFIKTPAKNSMIPCGIDLSQFQPTDKAHSRIMLKIKSLKKIILFASAKDVPVKNFELAKRACEKFPEADLLELSEKSREEVSLLMNSCDLFLMTSLREGSPQTIKEALACNCPIVSTDVGDVKKSIAGVDGCYITSFDPEDVAEKIKLALNFSETTGRTNGRSRIMESGLDSKTIALKILEVYRKVLGNEDKR